MSEEMAIEMRNKAGIILKKGIIVRKQYFNLS